MEALAVLGMVGGGLKDVTAFFTENKPKQLDFSNERSPNAILIFTAIFSAILIGVILYILNKK